jgi:hypothetical protein
MLIRTSLAVTALALLAPAQIQLTKVIPDAASPGDSVLFEGANLTGVSVTFTATVGGFLGVDMKSVTLQPAGTNRWSATVPTMAGFTPPNAVPPGSPLGTVGFTGGRTTLPFYFLQGTFHPKTFVNPQTTTLGTGTTQSTGLGKPVVSLDAKGGAPVPGNASCVLEVQNLPPGTPTSLLLGFLAKAPYPMIGDGTLVLDLGLPYLVLPPVIADAGGQGSTPLPVPASATGVALGAQWAVLDPGLPGNVAISNGLSFQL